MIKFLIESRICVQIYTGEEFEFIRNAYIKNSFFSIKDVCKT